jgi:hypothetical protein
MGSGQTVVVQIGLANEFIETTLLRRDEASLERNRQAVLNLGERLKSEGRPVSSADWTSGGWLLAGVDVSSILPFLAEFQNHPGSMLTDPGPVRRYVERRQDGELSKWDVLFASLVEEGENPLDYNDLGIRIICQRRKLGRKSDARGLRITDNQRVASRGVERAGLTPEEIEEAQNAYRSRLEEGARERPINYPDRIYRAIRKRPLLIIHLLNLPGFEKPVVAWSISFPGTALEENRVEYVVNTTWMRENYPEELDDEELEPENG